MELNFTYPPPNPERVYVYAGQIGSWLGTGLGIRVVRFVMRSCTPARARLRQLRVELTNPNHLTIQGGF